MENYQIIKDDIGQGKIRLTFIIFIMIAYRKLWKSLPCQA